MRRYLPRALVALTVLGCLGVGGYAAQVRWAVRLARSNPGCVLVRTLHADMGAGPDNPSLVFAYLSTEDTEFEPLAAILADNRSLLRFMVEDWKDCPWYGRPKFEDMPLPRMPWNPGPWIPRRAFHATARQLTGQDLPNDPDALDAWLQSHPDLVWDKKLHRLVDAPPAPR